MIWGVRSTFVAIIFYFMKFCLDACNLFSYMYAMAISIHSLQLCNVDRQQPLIWRRCAKILYIKATDSGLFNQPLHQWPWTPLQDIVDAASASIPQSVALFGCPFRQSHFTHCAQWDSLRRLLSRSNLHDWTFFLLCQDWTQHGTMRLAIARSPGNCSWPLFKIYQMRKMYVGFGLQRILKRRWWRHKWRSSEKWWTEASNWCKQTHCWYCHEFYQS